MNELFIGCRVRVAIDEKNSMIIQETFSRISLRGLISIHNEIYLCNCEDVGNGAIIFLELPLRNKLIPFWYNTEAGQLRQSI